VGADGISFNGNGTGNDGYGYGGFGYESMPGLSYIDNLVNFFGANGGGPGWDGSNRNGAGESGSQALGGTNGNIVVYEIVTSGQNAKNIYINGNLFIGGNDTTMNNLTVSTISTCTLNGNLNIIGGLTISNDTTMNNLTVSTISTCTLNGNLNIIGGLTISTISTCTSGVGLHNVYYDSVNQMFRILTPTNST
jgi:hypothetical protein